jgi:hypothetical protein
MPARCQPSRSLAEAIAANRYRQARYRKYEGVLRRLRQRIFDYEDRGPETYAKAFYLIERCKEILQPLWEAQYRARQAAQLERTPSAFEPGLHGRIPEGQS